VQLEWPHAAVDALERREAAHGQPARARRELDETEDRGEQRAERTSKQRARRGSST
jgi:hypothetical protein